MPTSRDEDTLINYSIRQNGENFNNNTVTNTDNSLFGENNKIDLTSGDGNISSTTPTAPNRESSLFTNNSISQMDGNINNNSVTNTLYDNSIFQSDGKLSKKPGTDYEALIREMTVPLGTAFTYGKTPLQAMREAAVKMQAEQKKAADSFVSLPQFDGTERDGNADLSTGDDFTKNYLDGNSPFIDKQDVLRHTEGEVVGQERKYADDMIQSIMDEVQGADFKNHPLRMEYEQKVTALHSIGEDMLQKGTSKEDVAKTLNQMRRDLGVQYKDLTPEPLREYIYDRNRKRYNGDPLGPTFERLLDAEKTYDDIIKSATRPNGDINYLLKDFERWAKEQYK